MMELVLKKLGNSTGLTFPAAFLKEHGLSDGVVMDVQPQQDGSLLLRPMMQRKRYTAAELNAQCDLSAPYPDDLLEWENAPAVGSEAL